MLEKKYCKNCYLIQFTFRIEVVIIPPAPPGVFKFLIIGENIMKKELVNYAVKNVFRRAMEAKNYLYNEDGTMPQAVREAF